MQPWERTFLLSASELQTWLKVHSWFCGKLHRILGSRQFVFFSILVSSGEECSQYSQPNQTFSKFQSFPRVVVVQFYITPWHHGSSWALTSPYIALIRPACSDVCVALQGICPAGGRKPEVPWWHMAQIANIGLSDLSIGQRTQDKVGQLKFSSSLSLSVMTRNHHTSCGAFQCRESLSLWLLHPFMDLTELRVELVSEYSMLWKVALPLGFLDFAALSSKTLVSSRGDLLQNKGPNNYAQKNHEMNKFDHLVFRRPFEHRQPAPTDLWSLKSTFPPKCQNLSFIGFIGFIAFMIRVRLGPDSCHLRMPGVGKWIQQVCMLATHTWKGIKWKSALRAYYRLSTCDLPSLRSNDNLAEVVLGTTRLSASQFGWSIIFLGAFFKVHTQWEFRLGWSFARAVRLLLSTPSQSLVTRA